MVMATRPKIPTNVQNELLTHLISILEGVADHKLAFRRLSRKRKRGNSPNGEKEDAVSTPSGAPSVASLGTVVSQIYKTQTLELNLLSTTWWWVSMR
jgi:hypothetical protein